MAVVSPLVTCPSCDAALSRDSYNTSEMAPCPGCGQPVQVEVFPALALKPREGQLGEEIVVDGQSSCFYHPTKKAESHCDGCGRFLCALCSVDLAGGHYCSSCVEAGVTRGKIKSLNRGGAQYGRLAFSLSILALIPWFTLLAAPATFYFAIRYWKRSESIIGQSRGWNIVAIVLASLGILLQGAIVMAMMGR